MEGIYKVNLVPNDLTIEETILQISDTLDNLNGIIDDVFGRLTRRIEQNMDKTVKLNDRIEISKTKIEKLTGMQKAIKVFSCAKYPTSITHEHYKSVFDLERYLHEPKNVTLSGKSQGLTNDKGVQEKLHFYHVKVAEPITPRPEEDFKLNAIIDDLQTVGELLIFNSGESPYLGTITKVHTYVPAVNSNVDSKSLLEAAPSSILKKDLLKREMDEYMYAPGMGMVPELEMPLDLPHLPGIAGDIQFLITSDGSIAPSVVTSPVTPMTIVPESELPELPDLKELSDAKPDSSVLKVGESLSDMPDAPPPPPPVVSVRTVEAQIPPPPTPPPPPPPPPMDAPLPAAPKREEKPTSSVSRGAGSGVAHADLMAAIRNAGGAGRAKLRSAADADPTKSKEPVSTGDLMADLHAKLSMRRRGISGAERAGGSVLHTLATIIPEPGEQSSPPRSSGEEDWE